MDTLPEDAEDDLLRKPSPARMYDYFLGGDHNFEVDRLAAAHVIQILPDVPRIAQVNRAFLRRVVTFLLAQGIDQFLDIGSGIATVGNVHEMAQRANPDVHVVYVDIDPIAVRHSNSLLHDNAYAVAVHADARQPAQLLNHPDIQRIIDWGKPLGVLLLAMLHFIPNTATAYDVVRELRDAVAPGSYLAISHATLEGLPRAAIERTEQIYAASTNPFKIRPRTDVEPFFDGLALVEPGLVYVPTWRPEDPEDLFLDEPARSQLFGGVGRKP